MLTTILKFQQVFPAQSLKFPRRHKTHRTTTLIYTNSLADPSRLWWFGGTLHKHNISGLSGHSSLQPQRSLSAQFLPFADGQLMHKGILVMDESINASLCSCPYNFYHLLMARQCAKAFSSDLQWMVWVYWCTTVQCPFIQLGDAIMHKLCLKEDSSLLLASNYGATSNQFIVQCLLSHETPCTHMSKSKF